MEECLEGREASTSFGDSVCDVIRASLDAVAGSSVPFVDCMLCVDDCLPAVLAVASMVDEVADRPVPVISDYRLPGWLSAGMTVVLVSHSCDSKNCTREYERLRARGCKVLCLTSDEKMMEWCRHDGVRFHEIPTFDQYSKVLGYVIGAVTGILDGGDLRGLREHLLSQIPSIIDFENRVDLEAGKVAPLIKGKVVSIYAVSDVLSVAMCERILLGMTPGMISFFGELPEFDHNELVGWSDPNEHASELTMLVMRGSRGDGLVQTIVDCMLEVLDENGRQVVIADLGNGPSIRRSVCGIILSYAIATDTQEVGK